jgi:hypothetical protein
MSYNDFFSQRDENDIPSFTNKAVHKHGFNFVPSSIARFILCSDMLITELGNNISIPFLSSIRSGTPNGIRFSTKGET